MNILREQIRKITYTLLLLYVGYSVSLSLFVHMHIYQGMVYVHSHPFVNTDNSGTKENSYPFQSHEHTGSTFFTLNQLSNVASGEGTTYIFVSLNTPSHIYHFTELVEKVEYKESSHYFALRAPPSIA